MSALVSPGLRNSIDPFGITHGGPGKGSIANLFDPGGFFTSSVKGGYQDKQNQSLSPPAAADSSQYLPAQSPQGLLPAPPASTGNASKLLGD